MTFMRYSRKAKCLRILELNPKEWFSGRELAASYDDDAKHYCSALYGLYLNGFVKRKQVKASNHYSSNLPEVLRNRLVYVYSLVDKNPILEEIDKEINKKFKVGSYPESK